MPPKVTKRKRRRRRNTSDPPKKKKRKTKIVVTETKLEIVVPPLVPLAGIPVPQPEIATLPPKNDCEKEYDREGILIRKTYYEKNRIMSQTLYINNKIKSYYEARPPDYQHGLCIVYREKDGTISASVDMIHDSKKGLVFHGYETFYDTRDNVVSQKQYSQGEIVKHDTLFDNCYRGRDGKRPLNQIATTPF